VDGQDVVCEVIEGGELGERKGVSTPGKELDLPPLTDLDRRDIVQAIEAGVDWIAASFVCKAGDVRELRKLLTENGGGGIGIFAKIESQAGVDNFDEILREADGIMVARGDLGVELHMEEVPVLQKEFIRKCNAAGKPVITATQMLDSMVRNNRPTRAEVNDVANSVLDGTDAVMLSGETASGKHPLEALQVMARIAEHVEGRVHHRLTHAEPSPEGDTITNALSYACSSMADDLHAAAIIIPTRSGETARNVAKFRPQCMQIATTDTLRVYHQLAVVWGVHSLYVQSSGSTDGLMRDAVKAVVGAGFARKGDLVIISAGVPVGVPGGTNLIKAQVVGDESDESLEGTE
jgi:pyruvate kinase